MIRTGVVTRVLWSSRHKTYSLNWEESTPPPQDAFTLKPFRNRRSRTYREDGVTLSTLLCTLTHVHTHSKYRDIPPEAIRVKCLS